MSQTTFDPQKVWREYLQDALKWRKEAITLRAKDGTPTRYVDSPARQKVRRCLRTPGHHAVLKPRQVGVSTEVLLGALHRCQFRAGSRVAIAAHTAEASKKLLTDFYEFYLSQPEWLKAYTRIVARNTTTIEFDNGSKITSQTASSESWRSKTFDYLLLSEVAHWQNYGKTVQALLQCAAPEAIVIYETTPKGPNDFHAAWTDPTLRWHRVFLPWTDAPEYNRNEEPQTIPPNAKQYIQENNLTKKQANWFVYTLATKCNSDLDTFKQEYPIDAESCFLTSGRRFFPGTYGMDTVVPQHQLETALFSKPAPDHRYAIGIDGASGSPTGDFSALVILDVTKSPYTVVLRYAARLPPNQWADNAAKLILAYKPRAILVESNHVGVAIGETLSKMGARPMRKDGKLAWTTTATSRPKLLANLHSHLAKHRIEINDPMIAGQMDTFVYNDKGKPEAASGKHDDLVFALALALQAAPYVPTVQDHPNQWEGGMDVEAMVRRDIRQFKRHGSVQPTTSEWTGI